VQGPVRSLDGGRDSAAAGGGLRDSGRGRMIVLGYPFTGRRCCADTVRTDSSPFPCVTEILLSPILDTRPRVVINVRLWLCRVALIRVTSK
jgi:hypothetical protein